MKKLVLTSLMAVFAVSGAHAANVINNNPLYRPEAGQFYSVTSVDSSTEDTKVVGLNEEFGYGITNRLAVAVSTSAAQADWFDATLWNDVHFGLNLRALDMGNWKGDIYASYGVEPIWGHNVNMVPGKKNVDFLDKDLTAYDWTVGVRGGYVADMWTVAGHVAFGYLNSESFNWNDEGIHTLAAGVDGQLVLNQYWNLIAGAEYTTILDDKIDGVKVEHPGVWTAKFGANFNFDSDKFLGAYVTKEMSHEEAGKWEVADGFGFGATFGIQF